ncbi:glycosyltransferase family 2 protein [Aphanizomenon flos-aquae]|jgi:glycosyltransferase involved in cell wall biosynthesis|uniref:Glycosyltransferase family 2 protein n=1 Tax=Aphanizomenon flos-aquae FACHB-1040 TaxID=2692887 RepID=A0ABR8BYC7_APHFL|nr:glycosyltransferase family A protein [Aphanizomenon flos-aquae]MBD2279243.1 glycosyltransferase family 2 protein [Aphanizomenon flos-aquae FACHB-1040]
MNEQPLVSCIIIFLNCEKFIEEAIESVFSQTYENWELLLVDDGSTDSSTIIAKCYAQKYPEKVRYCQHDNHQNRGTGASRNLGIDYATGKYIAFLDADDIWLSHKLEQQVKILESQSQAAMVYGNILFWYSWKNDLDAPLADYLMKLGFPANTLVEPPEMLIPFLQDSIQIPATSDVMIHREVCDKFGRFEENFRGYGEDRVFYLKVILNAPIFVTNECWTKYRQHDDSFCAISIQNGQLFSAYQAFFNWIKIYLSAQGMKDTEVWQIVQKEGRRYYHPLFYYLSDLQQLTMWIGRRILSKKVRHWLWLNFGAKVLRM